MRQLTKRLARSPEYDFLHACQLRLVELPQKGWKHLAGFQIVIVARPLQKRRLRAYEIRAILAAVRLTQLDARDLGDGIPFVDRLQEPGQQCILSDLLGCEVRVNAA